ncbi:MAG: T9SS type A sorting domain-containing protein [Candidatus Marinimicrobia bacterium]|nr:T9SS type A sorting domain-containing protein [FCB group bacterium]MBL7024477.1 T9SS type A sorting domain-containing protein [Candidatus Neomarinimicrobiota bacterium]
MRRFGVIVLILMVLCSWAWGQTALDFGQIWHKPNEEPLIYTIGDSGAWNGSGDMWDWNWGHVLQDADTFKLYIGGSDGTNFSIGMWHTMDLESGWTEYAGNPVLERSATGWDSCHVGGPMVIKDGAIYKMWYTGTAYLPTHGRNKTIGYATSTDGVNWDKHSGPVINPTQFIDDGDYVWLRNPFVIQDADTFKMWLGVSKVDPTFEAIHYAYSLDGVNWTFPSGEPVLTPKTNRWLEIPSVHKIGGQYVMWAMEGGYGAGYAAETIIAQSSDGIHWRRDELYNPVLRRDAVGNFGATGVGIYDVIETDEGLSAIYGGWDASMINHVGLAKYNPTMVPAGDVSGTWTKAESPYRVQGELTIPDGETLTIEAGTTIEFLTHAPLLVQGQLLAVGSEAEVIRFMVDDTLGFSVLNSTLGVWDGILFNNIATVNDSSLLKYCEIQYAKSFSNSGGWTGGGLTIFNSSKIRVENSYIHHNRALSNYLDVQAVGGGMFISDGAHPEIVNNEISDNVAKNFIDNIGAQGGGIMIYETSHPLIQGNKIHSNHADDTGGGISIISDCNPMIIGNLIYSNTAISNSGQLGYGGGVSIVWDSDPIFINNTIANNRAVWGGGGVYFNGARAKFINTIIADNIRMNANEWENWGHNMAMYGNTMSTRTIDVYNSCLEGGIESIMWGVGNTGDPGHVNFEESLSIDPHLVTDYSLNTSRSACIGAGTSTCVIDGVTYHAPSQDVTGHIRPDPVGSSPDMGAFESNLSGHRVTSAWNWWHWPGNPVFSPGVEGSYDGVAVYAPEVLFYEGQYHMWYTGDDGLRKRICHATSSDGINWDRDPGNPVLTSDPAGWQDEYLEMPRVVIVDDLFHMWFRTNARAGHATSLDGTNWTLTPGPVLEGSSGTWDSDFVVFSDVIYQDSLFHGWYIGTRAAVARVGFATSPDGIEWTKDVENNPVFDPSENGWDSQDLYASSVVFNGEYYYMWYFAHDNTNSFTIGRATSMNGIDWNRTTVTEPEIGFGESGSWNETASYYPTVLLNQGGYEIWYTGWSANSNIDQIGYASMEPVDVETRYVEMPQSFMLSQNFPNPFNPMTHIRYSLPESGDIRLVVYDLLGREVVELVSDHRSVGNYETTWYGLDRHGNQVSTGVYFARLEAGRNVDVIKMLYLK